MQGHDASPSERAETDSASDADPRLAGIARLRERRGSEKVTFDEVADHLADFVERHPHAREEIDNLAAFLAGVEGRPHEHPGGGTSTVSSAASS